MVDLAEIQAAYYMVAATGVLVAAIYYVMTLRTTQRNMKASLETRQAQLFMQIYDPFRGKEFQRAFVDVRSMKFKDYQEFIEKYGPEANPELYTSQLTVGNYFEGVGMLVKRNLLDISFVENLLSTHLVFFWEKMNPVYAEFRIRNNRPKAFEWVEYLYNELARYEKGLEIKLSSTP